MQVDTSTVLLVVWACREKHPKDANDYNLRNRLIIRHVSLVEVFDWMHCPQIKPGRLVLTSIDKQVHVLL